MGAGLRISARWSSQFVPHTTSRLVARISGSPPLLFSLLFHPSQLQAGAKYNPATGMYGQADLNAAASAAAASTTAAGAAPQQQAPAAAGAAAAGMPQYGANPGAIPPAMQFNAAAAGAASHLPYAQYPYNNPAFAAMYNNPYLYYQQVREGEGKGGMRGGEGEGEKLARGG